MTSSKTPNPSPRRVQQGIRVLLALIAVVVFVAGLRWIHQTGLLPQALRWIQELGPWGPVAFLLIYVAAVVFFVPASIFTVGAGFVYGMFWGSVYVLISAYVAANLTFLIARHFARDWVTERVKSHVKFAAIDEAVAREGWKIVALVRLTPIFPFSLMSYAFGLTRVPLWQYFAANITMIPGTCMYVYFGTLARDLTERVATPPWLKWGIGAVAVIVVLYITRFARRALARRIS
jgi:uncharacterized membrane protein YdjX (TVP38/TMEM64 family)